MGPDLPLRGAKTDKTKFYFVKIKNLCFLNYYFAKLLISHKYLKLRLISFMKVYLCEEEKNGCYF